MLDLAGSSNVQVLPYERLLEFISGSEGHGHDISSTGAIRELVEGSNIRFVVVPTVSVDGASWRLQADFRDTRTGLTVGSYHEQHLFERRLEDIGQVSPSVEAALSSMMGPLASGIHGYFTSEGANEALGWIGWLRPDYRPRPPHSRPQTLASAVDFEEGTNAYVEREYGQALTAFRRLVEKDAEFALGHAWVGRIYGILGYEDEALASSEAAAQLIRSDTPVTDTLFIAANLAESRYDFATAEEHYRALIDRYPDEPTWYAALGAVYDKETRYDEAIESYHEALNRDSRYVAAHLELGRLYTQAGDFPLAEQHGQAALTSYHALVNRGGEARALLVLGDASREQSEYQEALDRFETALKMLLVLGHDLNTARAYGKLGDVYSFVAEQPAEALDYYQKALSGHGEIQDNRLAAVTFMSMGNVYARLGRPTDTLDHWQRSIQLASSYRDDRRTAQVLSNLGSHMIRFGPDPDQGFEYAQRALSVFQEIGNRSWEMFNRQSIGIHHTNAGEYTEALSELQRALPIARAIDDQHSIAGLNYEIARCYFLQNEYGLAREFGEEALAQANEEVGAEARILLARIATRLGEFERPRDSLAAIVSEAEEKQLAELLPQAYAALGELHYEAGENDEAVASFRKALATGSGDIPDAASVEARSYLALLQADEGNLGRALLDGQQSVEQAKRTGRVYLQARTRLNLARVYLKDGNVQDAVQTLDEGPQTARDRQGGGGSQDGPSRVPPELLAQIYHLRGQASADAELADLAHQQAREIVLGLQKSIPESARASFAARASIEVLLRQPLPP